MNLDRPTKGEDTIMKFKIRDAKPEPEEPTLELWLEKRPEDRGVRLMGKLGDGPTLALLDVGPEGIYRYSGCSGLGLSIDPNLAGRVKDTTP